jgi:hypothetical protein
MLDEWVHAVERGKVAELRVAISFVQFTRAFNNHKDLSLWWTGRPPAHTAALEEDNRAGLNIQNQRHRLMPSYNSIEQPGHDASDDRDDRHGSRH